MDIYIYMRNETNHIINKMQMNVLIFDPEMKLTQLQKNNQLLAISLATYYKQNVQYTRYFIETTLKIYTVTGEINFKYYR